MLQHSFRCRLLSLMLAVTMLVSILPVSALAESPWVKMSYTCSDAQPMVGSQMSFSFTGGGCEAYKLMVVTPDSRQHFYDGPQAKVPLTVPGLHVFVGYGTNDASPGASGKILCMTDQVWIMVEGTAAPVTPSPEETDTITPEPAATTPAPAFIGNLSLTVNTDPLTEKTGTWKRLEGKTFYDPEIRVKLTVDAPLPEDAQVTMKWKIGKVSETLVDVSAGASMEWIGNVTNVLPDWLLDTWDVHSMSVEGCVRLADGTEKSISADFKLDTYTNEMRYVNQFIGADGHWSSSAKGRALVKWLSIYERDQSDRNNSGYLLLQEVAVNHITGGYKWGNIVAKTIMLSAETISSFGTNFLINAGIDKLLFSQMFGDAGQKALPYYTMLSSVYTDYIASLMTEMEEVQTGAAIMEDIKNNSTVFKVVEDRADVLKEAVDYGGNIGVAAAEYSKQVCYITFDANEYDMLHLFSMDPVPGKDFEGDQVVVTVTDMFTKVNPDTGLEMPYVKWYGDNGRAGEVSVQHIAESAIYGNYLTIDFETADRAAVSKKFQTALNDTLENGFKYSGDGDRMMTITGKVPDPDTSHVVCKKMSPSDPLAEEAFNKINLERHLSPFEQKCVNKLKKYINEDPEKIKKRVQTIGTVLDVAGTTAEVLTFVSSYNYESDLQKAYFSVFSAVTEEYINSLIDWRQALADSDVPHADLIQAALNALIIDILSTQDKALSEARQNFNLNIKKGGQMASMISGVVDTSINIVKLIPKVKATCDAMSKQFANTALGKGIAQGTSFITSKMGSFLSGAKAAAGPAAVISLLGGFITGGYFDYDESIKSTYYSTWALSDHIIEELESYQSVRTDMQAKRIIQLLGVMQQMKYYGEDLVMMNNLGDMFDDFGITDGKSMTILFNELTEYYQGSTLKAENYSTTVRLVLENSLLGTKKDFDDNGGLEYEAPEDFAGIFGIATGSDSVLGAVIRGIYRLDQKQLSYQGYSLPQVTADVLALPNSRENAGKPIDHTHYVWYKGSPILQDDWMNFKNAFTRNMYTESAVIYSHDDVELLLTMDEYRTYIHGQTQVNQLLSDPKYNRDESPESKKKQYVQHMLWHDITRRYIESLDMYDPSIQYRND